MIFFWNFCLFLLIPNCAKFRQEKKTGKKVSCFFLHIFIFSIFLIFYVYFFIKNYNSKSLVFAKFFSIFSAKNVFFAFLYFSLMFFSWKYNHMIYQGLCKVFLQKRTLFSTFYNFLKIDWYFFLEKHNIGWFKVFAKFLIFEKLCKDLDAKTVSCFAIFISYFFVNMKKLTTKDFFAYFGIFAYAKLILWQLWWFWYLHVIDKFSVKNTFQRVKNLYGNQKKKKSCA